MLQLSHPVQPHRGVPNKMPALTAKTLSQGTGGYLVLSNNFFVQPQPDYVFVTTADPVVLGTAGTYSVPFDIQGMMDFRGPAQLQPMEKLAAVVVAPSTAQLLKNIRDIFALRTSELAQIFGVSRRAVYDWLEGVTPRPDTVNKIYALSIYADKLKKANITHVEHYLHRPVVSGLSLLELLKSGQNIETAIDVIKHTALEEAKNRKRLGRRASEANTANVDGFDEVSTPIID
jgi:hypothetical protein